jgi:putative transporter
MNKEMFSTENLKKFFYVTLGSLILAIGIHFFIVPTKLVTGGASGFALLISLLTGVNMSAIYFAVNLVLIVLGIVTIGMTFGVLTIYSSMATSFFLYVLENIYNMKSPIIDDLLVSLLFGIIISAMGMVLVLNNGASTGGTDILGKMIEKYTHLSFANGLLICDGFITIGAWLIFGPKIGMYGIIEVVLNAALIDKMISGFNTKYNVSITSEKVEEINEFILNELGRGSTVYHAQGGFSGEDKKILTSVLDKKQYIQVKNYVKSIDHRAFFYVYTVSEIEGEGFTF